MPRIYAMPGSNITPISPNANLKRTGTELAKALRAHRNAKKAERNKAKETLNIRIHADRLEHPEWNKEHSAASVISEESALSESSEEGYCLREIAQCDWERDFIKIQVIVDSGACDHVGPPSILPNMPIKETVASEQKLYYQAVNGARIPNLGCKDISAISDLGYDLKIRM